MPVTVLSTWVMAASKQKYLLSWSLHSVFFSHKWQINKIGTWTAKENRFHFILLCLFFWKVKLRGKGWRNGEGKSRYANQSPTTSDTHTHAHQNHSLPWFVAQEPDLSGQYYPGCLRLWLPFGLKKTSVRQVRVGGKWGPAFINPGPLPNSRSDRT